MNTDFIAPRLLAWGMTSAGLGLGLIVAAFVGRNTPVMVLWGAMLLGVGATISVTSYLVRSKRSGQ
jgi:ABC-type uncharacterized transport system permease subunit